MGFQVAPQGTEPRSVTCHRQLALSSQPVPRGWAGMGAASVVGSCEWRMPRGMRGSQAEWTQPRGLAFTHTRWWEQKCSYNHVPPENTRRPPTGGGLAGVGDRSWEAAGDARKVHTLLPPLLMNISLPPSLPSLSLPF